MQQALYSPLEEFAKWRPLMIKRLLDPSIEWKNEKRRIVYLKAPIKFTAQLSIHQWTTLMILDLSGSKIKSIPSSIVMLQNLRDLNLADTTELQNLPEEFGSLTSLCKLDLCGSAFKSIPSSIGMLRNLRDLNLKDTGELQKLPEEFGSLSSLCKLNLCKSAIKSIPSSIGMLRNLRDLNL